MSDWELFNINELISLWIIRISSLCVYVSLENGEGEVVLLKGETVLVIGASPRRGHLLVEYNNSTLHVPYQFMELKACNVNV